MKINENSKSVYQFYVFVDYTTADNIKVFFCKHVFHDSCLSTFDHQVCLKNVQELVKFVQIQKLYFYFRIV